MRAFHKPYNVHLMDIGEFRDFLVGELRATTIAYRDDGGWDGISEGFSENYANQCSRMLGGIEALESHGYEGQIPVPIQGRKYGRVMQFIADKVDELETGPRRSHEMDERIRHIIEMSAALRASS